jgi:uncharacterized membrane protein
MNLQNYKAILIVVISVLALLAASPALQTLLIYPQTEFYSAMWILGPQGKAENFPFNLTSGTSYKVYMGIENQLGNCAYYKIQVKFRNLTQPAPNDYEHTPSNLPPLYSLNCFVADKTNLTIPVTFKFDYTSSISSYNPRLSKVNFNELEFNGESLNLEGYSTTWDINRQAFMGNLFFELWIYNGTTGSFQYHQRYTSLLFNMTVKI